MNVVTKITPNPETLKFIVNTKLLNSKGIEFKIVTILKKINLSKIFLA